MRNRVILLAYDGTKNRIDRILKGKASCVVAFQAAKPLIANSRTAWAMQ